MIAFLLVANLPVVAFAAETEETTTATEATQAPETTENN